MTSSTKTHFLLLAVHSFGLLLYLLLKSTWESTSLSLPLMHLGNYGITRMLSFWIFGTGGAWSRWGLPIWKCSTRVWFRLSSLREMKAGLWRMFWRIFKTQRIPACVFWTSKCYNQCHGSSLTWTWIYCFMWIQWQDWCSIKFCFASLLFYSSECRLNYRAKHWSFWFSLFFLLHKACL